LYSIAALPTFNGTSTAHEWPGAQTIRRALLADQDPSSGALPKIASCCPGCVRNSGHMNLTVTVSWLVAVVAMLAAAAQNTLSTTGGCCKPILGRWGLMVRDAGVKKTCLTEET
jgi:hypothetical protein